MGQENKYAISVVMPCYNTAKYLPHTLESLEKQTLQDFEYIFVNDGSTDETLEMLEAFAARYPERVQIRSQENGGQSKARNVGMELATGEYIVFLDSDDYIIEDYFQVLYEAGRAADSDMILSGQKKVDEAGNVIASIDYPVDQYPDYCLRRLNPHGKMYRRSFLEKHHIRYAEGKIYEDNAFNFYAMFLCKNQVILPYNGHRQVIHSHSTMTRKLRNQDIPYEEYERSIAYVLGHPEDLIDRDLFEFTILSFFTYFIFQANRKHIYATEKLKDRKSDMSVVDQVCDYTSALIPKYFPQYYKNPHVGIMRHRYLSLAQRGGVWLFVKLLKCGGLKQFAHLVYRL